MSQSQSQYSENVLGVRGRVEFMGLAWAINFKTKNLSQFPSFLWKSHSA